MLWLWRAVEATHSRIFTSDVLTKMFLLKLHTIDLYTTDKWLLLLLIYRMHSKGVLGSLDRDDESNST